MRNLNKYKGIIPHSMHAMMTKATSAPSIQALTRYFVAKGVKAACGGSSGECMYQSVDRGHMK